jgi:hypothetical protein
MGWQDGTRGFLFSKKLAGELAKEIHLCADFTDVVFGFGRRA